MAENEKKGGMTVAEAGRKGGVKVAQERGRAFYEQIGKKGGDAVKAERGTPFYEEIGKKGGHKVRQLIEEGKKAASEALAARNERMADEGVPAVGGEVVPAMPE